MEKMDARMERFCREYVRCMDAPRAAVAAGYNKRTAGPVGRRMLDNKRVARRLDELRANLADACGLSEVMIVNELKKIAFADVADLRSVTELKDLGNLPAGASAPISEIACDAKTVDGCRGPVVKMKFYNKMEAIDKLTKMLGYGENSKDQYCHPERSRRAKDQNPSFPTPQIPKVVIIENPHLSESENEKFKNQNP